MVYKLAHTRMNQYRRWYSNSSVLEFGDFVSIGLAAILSAANSYQFNKNTSFNTHVYNTIDGKMKNFIRDKATVIRTPRMVSEYRTKRDSFVLKYINNYGVYPSDEVIMSNLGLTEKQYNHYLNHDKLIKNCISFDDSLAAYNIHHVGNDVKRRKTKASKIYTTIKKAKWQGKTPNEIAKKIGLPLKLVEEAYYAMP